MVLGTMGPSTLLAKLQSLLCFVMLLYGYVNNYSVVCLIVSMGTLNYLNVFPVRSQPLYCIIFSNTSHNLQYTDIYLLRNYIVEH